MYVKSFNFFKSVVANIKNIEGICVNFVFATLHSSHFTLSFKHNAC